MLKSCLNGISYEFKFFKKANDIQKKIHKNYSIKQEVELFKKIKNVFEKANFTKYTQHYNNKKLIFIVGLPRSGTTLTHQILAAHSKVYGAGRNCNSRPIHEKKYK